MSHTLPLFPGPQPPLLAPLNRFSRPPKVCTNSPNLETRVLAGPRLLHHHCYLNSSLLSSPCHCHLHWTTASHSGWGHTCSPCPSCICSQVTLSKSSLRQDLKPAQAHLKCGCQHASVLLGSGSLSPSQGTPEPINGPTSARRPSDLNSHQRVTSILVHFKGSKITSHPSGWLLSKKKKITSVGEDVEKLEHLCTVGGNVNWYSHYGNQYEGSSKN